MAAVHVLDYAIVLLGGLDPDVLFVSEGLLYGRRFSISVTVFWFAAECDPDCAANGGQCVAPFKCLCPAGLTGHACLTGMVLVHKIESIRAI